MQRSSEENPLILTFLEQNQIPELIRLMFNRKTAEEYLLRYGAKTDSPPKRQEQSLMEDYVSRFQIKDIVLLKGSQRGNVRHYCNTFIAEFLSRKLARGHKLTHEQRRSAYLQLTDYYQLENLYEGLNELELPLEVSGLIKKDVSRTYLSPDLDVVGASPQQRRLRESEMRVKVTQVLQRLAKYNPFIGYCQGMNTIALFLLQLGFNPQEAFFVFKKITEELLPCDFYSSMDSTMALVRLLFQVLHLTHPRAVVKMKRIIRHMQGDDRFIVALSFVFQWFVCLFTNVNLPRAARTAIMDRFLLEGVPVLFKASLAFFDVLEEPIQKVKGIEDYMPQVERRMREFTDMAILENRLNSTYINKNILLLLKQKLLLHGRATRKRENKDNCNPKWNVCLQTIQDHLADGRRLEFFVFRTNEELKLIDNYFDKFHNQYFRIGKSKTKTDVLRLGRMPHACRRSTTSNTNDDDNSKRSLIQYNSEINSANSREKRSPSGKRGVAVGEFESKGGAKEEAKEGERKNMLRCKALKSLEGGRDEGQNERKSVFSRSDSVQFMRSMIQNESFSNLLEILEEDQMESIFKSVIEE